MTAEKSFVKRWVRRDISQALFAQLEEIIRDAIENNIWHPGEAIHSERELSKIYGLSRMTVRRALDRLVSAGLLYRVDGKGTFVSEPKMSLKALSLSGFREQALRMGWSPSAKLLGVDKVLATEKVAEILHVAPDSPVYLIERVVLGNEMSLGLHRSYIPVNLCPTLDQFNLVTNSLYKILREEYSIVIGRASETLESTLATDREQLLLGVAPNSPMFLLRIVMYDPQNRPIEYVKVIFRGDRVQLSLDIK